MTDPCYIMDEKQYDAICEKGCHFEEQKFPLASTRKDDGAAISFATIVGTPNGDGSYVFRGQEIGVDSGMLCVAVCEAGWGDEKFGATFADGASAMAALERIVTHF